MKRRQFSASVLGAGLGLGWMTAFEAVAQGGPIEGTHYVRLSQPQPVQTPGKIEVIEFFWYGCPHCNAFDPVLDAWVKKLPPDVAFRRVAVALRESWSPHQKIFLTLEAMGQLDAMHRRVFFAIHNERQRLEQPNDIAAFMQKNGIDSAKFLDVFNSFSIQAKQRQANTLAEAYKIDGVPALGINGQYFTSGTLAGSLERALAVTEFLVQKSRGKA
jgi:thiol:disulfide interchange protein DsbA